DVHANDVEGNGALHVVVTGMGPFGIDGQGGEADMALFDFLAGDRREHVQDRVTVLDVLLRGGADPKEVDLWGLTPLALARMRGLSGPDILRLLTPKRVVE